MGFDVPNGELHKVIYVNSVTRASKNPSTGRFVISSSSMERLMRTKFKDWEYEKEMRMFVKLKALNVESGKYFYPFSERLRLSEVILGVRCDLTIGAIGRMVDAWYGQIAVLKAAQKLASFGMTWDLPGSYWRV
jgi:hypothetical protein